MSRKQLSILGTRGIPAAHGGFETFAEYLALFLVEKGWDVVVYCQTHGSGEISVREWKGVTLIDVPVTQQGALGTIVYDWKTVLHAANSDRLILTLGYNTALFNLRFRMGRKVNIINMDGIEWKRKKWKVHERAWLYLNERLGCLIGNHLIADHPEIEKHLQTRVSARKITMIPYGAEEIITADETLLGELGLTPDGFALVVARPEPENSILEIVQAFSARRRGIRLVVLGNLNPGGNAYHHRLLEAASDEVMFPGAIYDKSVLAALRFHTRLYIHGHTVGGTNPSLVEALGAGSPVLAHDNAYNRWVAGQGAAYFSDQESCANRLDELLNDASRISEMSEWSRRRFRESFRWDSVLEAYEQVFLDAFPSSNEP